MAEITNEVLHQELLKVERGLAAVEREMAATSVELNRLLWEQEYGRQRIDRARKAYEDQVARRRSEP